MKKTIDFLRKLKRNNNTPWMQANKEEYLRAKKEFEFLTQEIIFRIREWDSKLPDLEPKDCIFRFNRDTRFSDNKSPYKENFGAYIAYGGKKGNLPGYYLHVSPKQAFVAGGLWMPEAQDLKNIRRFIMDNGDDLLKILKDKKFKKAFPTMDTDQMLKRPPKGYPADHPFIDLLKLKSFTVSSSLDPKDLLKPGLGKRVEQSFKLMKPFNQFFYEAIKDQDSSF